VAGNGEATAAKPDRPRRDSSGVAKEEPPTPNNPKSAPMTTPAAKIATHSMTAAPPGR